MRELSSDTMIVFVSDSHIGGDVGCDGFESPEELRALFEELAGREAPVELVLAGDFFDFLQISDPPEGIDRAEITISRPEYAGLFASLRRFAAGEGHRVVYLPGNHDAEVWWNPRIRETLAAAGLVHEFAPSYTASLGTSQRRFLVYCEHGNQFDPANHVRNYDDPLDTPLGHHAVTDFTRRVAPLGEVRRGLDLAEIKNVYPLVEIPRWVMSRFFYDAMGKVVLYLLAPFLVAYALYRGFAYYLVVTRDLSIPFSQSYLELPRIHELFVDVYLFALMAVAVFTLFFFAVRRSARRAARIATRGGAPRVTPAEESRERIAKLLRSASPPPMSGSREPFAPDVFVSGHTHLPSLESVDRDGGACIVANSGCWLRQLSPVPARFGGPPVFVSRFVLTHVRVFLRDGALRVELWEQPKPADQTLTRTERLVSWGRRPRQPGPNEEARPVSSRELPPN